MKSREETGDDAITVLDTRRVELQGKLVRDLSDDHKAAQARAANWRIDVPLRVPANRLKDRPNRA